MFANNRVAWTEGMYLAPQHFQQHDRFIEDLIHAKTSRALPYLWGVTELEIDKELLALGQLGITVVQGILPDGTVINAPHEDDLPKPVLINTSVRHQHIYLAVSLDKQCVLGSTEASRHYRYQIESQNIVDTTIGQPIQVDVPLKRLNLQLLIEDQELSGYSSFPICFIDEVRPDQSVVLDKHFIPPCLNTHAIPSLNRLVKEIQGLLHHRAESLSQRLTDEQQSETTIVIDFMLLQLINKYDVYFAHLATKSMLHPETLYQVLLQLLGEISTYSTEHRRPLRLSAYQHDALADTLNPIIKSLRHALTTILEQNATSIKLEEHQQGIWLARIENTKLLTDAHFVLAVYTDLSPDLIRTQFIRQAKLAPVEQLKDLIAHQLPGIDLQLMSIAPRQIPYHTNYVYFCLDQQHESWKCLEQSAALAIHVSGNMPNLKLELWAIKG